MTAASARPHSGPADGGPSYLTTVAASARRSALQFFRTPQVLAVGTIQGAMFLLMFRYVFGGAISTGNSLGYVDFLVPGFLVTGILWTGMAAAAGIAEDNASGVYDRFRSLPLPRSAILVGRTLADTALVGWAVLISAAIGFAAGFRTHTPLVHVIAAFVLIAVAAAAFAWAFVAIGLYARNAQAAQGLSMIIVPFSFVSAANVPVSSMPGWMQVFAANQPVTVVINAVRCLMQGDANTIGLGHTTTYWIALSLAWSAGIAVCFATISTRRFARPR